MIFKIIILFIFAYIAGSINFAILLFKIIKKDDPRTKFSGNAGTTNVYRIAGKFWAAAVFLLDIGRAVGVAAVSLYAAEPEFAPLCGLGLVLGNTYPLFHQFKGGKGVANYLGFTALFSPMSAALSAIVWVIVYLIIRTPFIASFFMITILACGAIITNNYKHAATTGSALTFLLILYNHKENIRKYFNKENQDEN